VLLLILLILSIIFLVVSTTRYNIHAFFSLLTVAIFFALFAGMPLPEIVNSVEEGFGGTIGKIGIVVIAGTVIGTFLEKSGGAFAMAEAILKLIGKKSISLTMAVVGYIVSIPVWADSGFVILLPLTRALTKRAKISLATTALSLSLGLIAAHTMMPPTPGPIAAAGILDADLGTVILIGFPISFAVAIVGWLFATKLASRVYIDADSDHTDQQISALAEEAGSPFKAFAPILVPIFLIVLKSIADYPTHPFGIGSLANFFSFIGSPLIALLIGILLALTLPKKFDTKMLSASGWVGEGILAAAIIILITGAGGAFGKVLQNSGIADVVGHQLSGYNIGIWLPFLIAAAIRVAQGSATVAIITTASILAPMTTALGLDSGIAKALMVLVIGSGSFVGAHANDSFFWIFTQMIKIDVRTGLKLMTLGSTVCGFSGAIIIWIVSLIVL
jgi:GntP family gluconate:H+ symporter